MDYHNQNWLARSAWIWGPGIGLGFVAVIVTAIFFIINVAYGSYFYVALISFLFFIAIPRFNDYIIETETPSF